MKLELKVYQCYCACKIFEINGKDADTEDFGIKRDTKGEKAEPHGCGNMEFIRKPATKEVLKKYNITLDEYNKICSKLEEKLSFGGCYLCD